MYTCSDMYRPDTVPKNYQHFLQPNAASAFSKVTEILIQDLVLLVIVKDLLATGYSYLSAGLLFASIVFIVHLPSPLLLGKIYGTILAVLATTSALVIPAVVAEFQLGFYIVFAVHVLVYALLLAWSRWMRA